MDTFINILEQNFNSWGIIGLILAVIISGIFLPLSSEVIILTMLKLNFSPIFCVFMATLGSTSGGMTGYFIGFLGKTEWMEKYLKIKKDKVTKAINFVHGKGAMMAFFTFLPFVGEALAIALGYLKSNIWITIVSMFIGKMLCNTLLIMSLLGIITIISKT